MNIIICKNVGISSLKLHWVESTSGKKLYKCRRFIAIMGSFNNPIEELIKASPFDSNVQENYAEGVGETKDLAIENMEKDESSMCDSLWAF